MKKLLALLLSLLISMTSIIAFSGCNNNSGAGDGDDVVIEIVCPENGYGTQWLQSVCDRLEEKYKDKDYGDGKVGVYCNITKEYAENLETMGTSGFHVYFGREYSATEMADSGYVLNLTDIVKDTAYEGKSIESKMNETYRAEFKAADDNYYAIPSHEVYAGLSYDKNLFDKYGLYFANPNAEAFVSGGQTPSYHESALVGFTGDNACAFVNKEVDNWESTKSVGPNGIAGDYDDGLPSSLYEFIALMQIMKDDFSVSPVQVSGKYANISNFFLSGLQASLMGAESYKATSTFNGPMNVVTTFTLDNLLGNIDYLYRPSYQQVNITEETGFYVTQALETYYAWSTLGIINNENWWANGSIYQGTGELSHVDAQSKLIYSGYKDTSGNDAEEVGMLMEASYWYTESTERNNFKYFYTINKEADDADGRDVRWMPLPVNIANSVTGEDETKTVDGITESVKGEKNVLAQCHLNRIYCNSKVGDDPALLKAVTDFIQFFCSDEELANVTLERGFGSAYDYEIPEEKLASWNNGFYKDLWQLRDKSEVIYLAGANATYNSNDRFQMRSETHGFFNCHRKSPAYCIQAGNEHSIRSGFVGLFINAEQWKNNYYKGSNPDGVGYLKDSNQNEIKYIVPEMDGNNWGSNEEI